jgi:hypothetical protein
MEYPPISSLPHAKGQETKTIAKQMIASPAKQNCRFCGSNTVPPEYSYGVRRTEVNFSLALSQMS